MAKESKEQTTQDLQIALLQAQLETLTAKIVKPQSKEEEYQARSAMYDAKKAEREALKAQIANRRMEIMQMPELLGKARMDEVIMLESWERLSKEFETLDPNYSIILMNNFKQKVRDIARDIMR